LAVRFTLYTVYKGKKTGETPEIIHEDLRKIFPSVISYFYPAHAAYSKYLLSVYVIILTLIYEILTLIKVSGKQS